MAIRTDPAIHTLSERVQNYIADDVASGRRSPYSEVALPLNQALLSKQDRIDTQKATIARLESQNQMLLEALKDMVESYEYEASSFNPALMKARAAIETAEANHV